MDEATAFLDPSTEATLQVATSTGAQGPPRRSLIATAWPTVEAADRILVLRKGRRSIESAGQPQPSNYARQWNGLLCCQFGANFRSVRSWSARERWRESLAHSLVLAADQRSGCSARRSESVAAKLAGALRAIGSWPQPSRDRQSCWSL